MAPRTAKAKKTSQSKVAENEAPKKGRGKTKTVEEPEIDEAENVVGDEAPVIEKKSKRGKKAEGDINEVEETNEDSEALPTKKGRKNKVADKASEEKEVLNGDNAAETKNSNPAEGEELESNGHSEEVPSSASGKGRKKVTKKESTASKAKIDTKTSSRGKKNTKQETEIEVTEKDEANEEKQKPVSKGRTRKAPQKVVKEAEVEEKDDSDEEEVIADLPIAKGRKRGPAKTVKEKTPESEQDEQDAEEDKPAEEPKKKETKGRKVQAKKAAAKNADIEENEEKQEPASKKRKVTKKDEKVSDEVNDEEPMEEEVAEPKPAKGKRGQKKVVEDSAKTEEVLETGDATNKRRRKAADEKASSEEIKKKAPPKNKTTTNYDEIDFTNTSKNVQGKEWNLKISSWNVDGIRAWLSKGGLDYLKYEKPDILCLQETKCAKDKLPDEIANLPGYHAYWQGSDKDGYAGVGIYTTKLAMNVQYGLQNEEFDNEGRIITAEYEQFYLICTYVPNAGRKLVTLPKRLQWNEEFRKYVKALNEKKPVIICGDMNVAHNEIDLSNPKSNKKNAGFTPEERAGMTDLLGDGFVDTYRHLKPDETGAYTFWTYMMNSRAKNVGWRLDYFLMSERLLPALCDSAIRSEVYGSDHCPITLFLHITSADKPKE